MALSSSDCKYCDPEYQSSNRIVLENEYWIGNFDNHPVSPGHMKLICRQHRSLFEELSEKEVIAFQDILRKAKVLIRKTHTPDGWNIGINEGVAAGQTVFHLHIHLIPRYIGDVENSAGGVRTILPEENYKNKYS